MLLINSKEQMFTEKLRSLLKFGSFSTRYKDVFDLCYLADTIDIEKLRVCMNTYIFSDPGMRENNMDEVINRITRTFQNKRYQKNIASSNKNWLNIDANIAFNKIIRFLKSVQTNEKREEREQSN